MYFIERKFYQWLTVYLIIVLYWENPDDNWKDMEHVYQNVFYFFCCVDLTGSISYQVHIIELVYTVAIDTISMLVTSILWNLFNRNI
jgi:hypothetical protein